MQNSEVQERFLDAWMRLYDQSCSTLKSSAIFFNFVRSLCGQNAERLDYSSDIPLMQDLGSAGMEGRAARRAPTVCFLLGGRSYGEVSSCRDSEFFLGGNRPRNNDRKSLLSCFVCRLTCLFSF